MMMMTITVILMNGVTKTMMIQALIDDDNSDSYNMCDDAVVVVVMMVCTATVTMIIAPILIVPAKGVICWKRSTFPGVARLRMKGWSCWQRAVRNSNISSAKDANRYAVQPVYTNFRLKHSCGLKTCGKL